MVFFREVHVQHWRFGHIGHWIHLQFFLLDGWYPQPDLVCHPKSCGVQPQFLRRPVLVSP